jgi:hypothetical protein
LGKFLRELNLSLSGRELEEAVFQFWPTYSDGTEPDVVITVGNYYILIEAKKNAGFGISTETEKNQLNREYYEGKNVADSLGKEFILLTITSDASIKLMKFEKTPHILWDQCFRWTNWQKFATLLNRILDLNMSNTPNRIFASDLVDLLERKKLREFRSFNDLDYRYNKSIGKIFFAYETAAYRVDFIGFENSIIEYNYSNKTELIFFSQNRFKGFDLNYLIIKSENQIFYARKEG